MDRTPINPHAFDEFKLQHESKQKSIDRLLEYDGDTRGRVDTLVKAVFLISGGALTVSIGIFLKSGAPTLAAHLVSPLRSAWWLLFYSIASSSALLFLMICQGYWFTAKLQRGLTSGEAVVLGGKGETLIRRINWTLGASGFIAFVAGLALLAYVSAGAIL